MLNSNRQVKKNEKTINEVIIKRAIEETECNLNLNHTQTVKKKGIDNITILEYVAKSFALLGRKVKSSMSKNKKKTDFFAEPIIMPISMKPKLIIENYEIINKKSGSRRNRPLASRDSNSTK